MKYFCVISHTHWDREWYLPLEIFRLKLVDLIDHCLETLRRYPEYVFHLDAQTVVLEDYLEFRPARREELRERITEGRLIVGPWYLQNDFYLTSGEATVRNLLEGTRLAAEFGRCSRVGYAADQFGNISQLPQILAGFGIDNFVFGRGFSEYVPDENGREKPVPKPSEFVWEGADGTRALAIHMKYWYNNAQRFSADPDRARLLAELTERQFEGVALTPYLLLMNGVDHLEAQDDLLPILAELNGALGPEREIRQWKLGEYVDAVRAYVSDHSTELPVQSGELRMGHDWDLLKGTLSSRSYLKRENVLAQTMLECRLEPLYAMLELYGLRGAYPRDHLRYLWKALLKNHPHDSICGCSRDEVHAHMEDSFWRLRDTGEELLRRGLQLAADHMELGRRRESDYLLIVANPTERAQSGVVEATFDFPAREGMAGFALFEPDGTRAEFETLSRERAVKDIFSPVNLPGCLDVDRYRVRIFAKDVQAFAVKGYRVRPAEEPVPPAKAREAGGFPVVVENEYIRLSVGEDGRAEYTDKRNGITLPALTELEETADRGDSYVYGSTPDPAIWGRDFPAEVRLLEQTDLVQRVSVKRTLRVPMEYDFARMRRSEALADCDTELIYTLARGGEAAEISYTLENRAKDHRIRLLVATGAKTTASTADIPFDVVTHEADDHCFSTMSRVRPNASFALLQDGDHGAAVFTEGQHEYEHLPESQSLAFTLVRSTGAISRTREFAFSSGAQWLCPGNQCLRTLTGRIGVFTYRGPYEAQGIPIRAKQFRVGLLPHFAPCDPKKFLGGRTAVQDTRLEEFFYLPDPYPEARIPNNESSVAVAGAGVYVTALKCAEDGRAILLRAVNGTDGETELRLEAPAEIRRCSLSEQVGAAVEPSRVPLRKKEIATFALQTRAGQ